MKTHELSHESSKFFWTYTFLTIGIIIIPWSVWRFEGLVGACLLYMVGNIWFRNVGRIFENDRVRSEKQELPPIG